MYAVQPVSLSKRLTPNTILSRPGHPIRLHVGLQMLKHMQALSDRELLDQWVENPYWQYFCGESVFQHEPPMDESTMGRFRRVLAKMARERF